MLEEMRENGESFLILHSGYRSSIIFFNSISASSENSFFREQAEKFPGAVSNRS